jgi:hypothetical protein
MLEVRTCKVKHQSQALFHPFWSRFEQIVFWSVRSLEAIICSKALMPQNTIWWKLDQIPSNEAEYC